MIRNLLVMNHGVLLVKLNFGECHSLGANEELVAGFISAMDIFSNEITGGSIKTINFEEYIFHFYKDSNSINNLYVFITDSEEDEEVVNFKINKIASLFYNRYSEVLKQFDGEINQFNDFKKTLLEMNLAQKNCGGRPECTGCTNSTKQHAILNSFENDKKGFMHRFKMLFKKSQTIFSL